MRGVASPINYCSQRPVAPADLPVVLDFDEDYPVTNEELDVLDAFLFQEIQTILDGGDSKQPQSRANLAVIS